VTDAKTPEAAPRGVADPKDVLALREAIDALGTLERDETTELLQMLSSRCVNDPVILLVLPATQTVYEVVQGLIEGIRAGG
jgi:hypothetical protein